MSRFRYITLTFTCLLLLLAGVRGFIVEPARVVVRHMTVTGTALGGVLRGTRVVVASDLHLGGEETGREILSTLKGISPDFLFLLGDYVRWRGGYEPALDFLSKLPETAEVVGVLGDYDHHDSRRSCLFCHERGRVTPTTRHAVSFLMNHEAVLTVENAAFRVVGLDRSNAGEARVSKSHLPTLVLAHDPLLFDALSGDEGIVMLAGDTHGGQFPLPSFLWRILGYEKNAKYNRGWYAKGSNRLFVTSGVGTSHVRFRLFCSPELVVMHFE